MESKAPRWISVIVLTAAVLGLVLTQSILAARGTVEIIRPEQSATISGYVEIRGSASDDNFAYYQLEYSPQGRTWTTIGQGQYTRPVHDGLLGKWDTNNLAPGAYQLRLSVADALGNHIRHTVQVTVMAP